ncbi:hypothetical protein E5676_scaffold745G00100 [Cucumis melo var. makuwa]|uniref:Uncharacterized protein n=1 Tax=Cucumis melo var. makuwa TaxID=1194695 RepID=A0A5D3CR62_CUCMM|nr:hypothetical protein E6C27_scaffold219G001360 [Cucumis melo var. makuwa]TYK13514.1 hypothetical protein E5676_scaffold745G00100 [Cucumis melo var. makuwa]
MRRRGDTTFLRHNQKKEEEDKEVSEIKLFQLTYSNEKKWWVNEAKVKYDQMMPLKTTSSQEGSEALLERKYVNGIKKKKKKLANCRGTRAKTRREGHISKREEVHYKTKVVDGIDVT